MLIQFDEDFMGLAAVSLHSSLKYRRNWDKTGPTVQLLRKFMPRGSKGFRVYVPIGAQLNRLHAVAPLQVRLAVQKAGFRITDYLAKKCVKISDKEQKNEFNIGKVIAKDPVAKAAFDNDPQLQNSSTSEFTMVVSCHPYDIIGMSTGRSWDSESCMRLADGRENHSDGMNKHYLARDVAEGTLVAYAVRTDDTNIEKPLGRCLLKPFLKEDGEDILYRRETKIYGNPVPGFADTLQRFMRKLNAGVPAGLYRLNSHLYNDGVGGNHEQEDSNEGRTENGVDWSIVDDDAKLSERPDLYPSFAAYMINKFKEDLTDSDAVMHILLSKADNIPAQFCKQAGRLIAQHKEMVVSFVDATTLDYDGVENARRFLKSKELRSAIVEHAAEYPSWVDDSNEATLVSKKYAHNFFMNMSKNTDAYWDTAYQLLEGRLDIPTQDIESIPEFHRIVYFLANITREASAFDYERNQETAHKMLLVLQPANISMDDTLLEQFKKFLRYYNEEYRIPAAALILSLLKAGQDEYANTVAMTMSSAGFQYAMRMRKFHRRFLALKGAIPQGLHLLITNSVASLMDDHAGNDESVAREIYTLVKRMPSYDALRADNYYTILRVYPDLYATLYYSVFGATPTDIDKAIYQLPNLERCHRIRERDVKANFIPLNDKQKQMWDLHGALMHIDSTTNAQIMVDYDPDHWINVIAGFKDALQRLDTLNVDLTKYPQFLNADTAKKLSPAQFINGKDNGYTVVDTLAKQGLFALAEAVESVFSEDPMLTMINTFSDFETQLPEMMITHVRRLNKKPDEEAQEFYDQCDGFVQVVEKFVNRMSPAPGEGFPERFAKEVDLPIEDVMEGMVVVPSMLQTLKTYLQNAKAAMGVFVLFSRGSNLKLNPIYDR